SRPATATPPQRSAGAPAPIGGGVAGHTPAGRPCAWKAPIVTALTRRLENVFAIPGTSYSPALTAIVRVQGMYFGDELAFIPYNTLNPRAQLPKAFRSQFGY